MVVWVQYVVPAALGLLGGTVASLIAPWVQWRVEKRRLRLNRRADLLNEARQFVMSDEYTYPAFMRTVTYSQLHPHLSSACKEQISLGRAKLKPEPGSAIRTIEIIPGGRDQGVNTRFRGLLLDEIASLERKWGIL